MKAKSGEDSKGPKGRDKAAGKRLELLCRMSRSRLLLATVGMHGRVASGGQGLIESDFYYSRPKTTRWGCRIWFERHLSNGFEPLP